MNINANAMTGNCELLSLDAPSFLFTVLPLQKSAKNVPFVCVATAFFLALRDILQLMSRFSSLQAIKSRVLSESRRRPIGQLQLHLFG